MKSRLWMWGALGKGGDRSVRVTSVASKAILRRTVIGESPLMHNDSTHQQAAKARRKAARARARKAAKRTSSVSTVAARATPVPSGPRRNLHSVDELNFTRKPVMKEKRSTLKNLRPGTQMFEDCSSMLSV